ncbi:hypothetical protein [Kitasatospora sp. MBT63]|uniref:hypothetical protein n=1 Tax=Kitasatospora sp. MBT63 TaxID=1444768 RepID=UPI00053A3A7B|nr:hypothetical protein [Kitasatospora sp. MBT63]
MTETVLVAIPCRVITLRMELGAEEGASTLEDLVLRAVAAGRNTVRDLGELFSLPNRLMLDVVHGLWSRGFLAVDFSTNTLENTRAAQPGLGEQQADRPVAAKVQMRKFLFDPVTAAVLLHRKGMDRIPNGAIAMPLARGISETDIPQTELLRAVREAVRTDRREHGVRQRVLDVSFANPMLNPSEAVHWNTVEVVVNRDPVTDVVTATPVQMPQGWGRRALQLFQARVSELVRNRPDSRFVQRLLSREVLTVVPPDSLRSLLVDLDRLAEGLDRVPPHVLPERHEELRGKAAKVLDQLAEVRRARCSVEPVVPGAGVEWVLKELIEQATHQLVLALPRITYDALHEVLPSLELAAKRGVTIVFLWGDTPSATLEGKVATALFDLQSRFSENILLEQRSSSCAASAVVCDDLCAYVGSSSPLSANTGAGVLVKPVEGMEDPPSCVADLLSWARRTYPYWEVGQNIALLPADFGRRRPADPSVDAGPALGGIPLPELDEAWNQDEVAGTTRWAADWGRVLHRLMEAVEEVYQGRPVVRAVWDGMYADLVQHAVDGATGRLAVTDDSAEAETCTDAFGQRLSRLRDKGVVIHLQHPPLRDGRRTPRSYAEIHRRLGAEGTLRSTRARARAVLSDHEMVVGSYRPLGNRPVNPARGPAPTELGLHIMNTAFTAEFAGTLGIRDWFGDPGDGGEAAVRPGYLPPLPSLSSTPVEADDWAVLENRLASGVAPERLRADSAGLLHGATGSAEQRQRWGRWLLHDAWRRHAFVEAYLLAPRLGGAETLPLPLAAVAVPVEHGPLGEQLYYSAVELADAPAEHRTVALVGAVAEMLLHGGDTGLLVCEALADSGGGAAEGLPPGWLELARQAAACFAATRAPVPLQDINAWAEQRNRSADVRNGWARLVADVNDFKRADQHFKFLDGKRMHRAMFVPPDGLLARVLAMADGDASDGFRLEGAAGLPDTELDARLHLDQLAMDQGLKKVEWSNHLAYARRVADMLAEARRLAELSAAEAERNTSGSVAALLPALAPEHRAFARLLDRMWHTLREEADELEEPARHPATALLGALASLPVIGREDS